MKRSYAEMLQFRTFQERLEYLRIPALVGDVTFGWERSLNQMLYSSGAWKKFRNHIILRDNGCDLACQDRDGIHPVIIHHINPITIDDILDDNSCIFDPNNVVCVSDATHRSIHYGSENPKTCFDERRPGDTCLWRKQC